MIRIQLLLRRIVVKIFAVVIVIFDIINVTLFTIDMVIKLKKVPNLCQHCTYHNTRSLMVLQSENETLLSFKAKLFSVFFKKKTKSFSSSQCKWYWKRSFLKHTKKFNHAIISMIFSKHFSVTELLLPLFDYKCESVRKRLRKKQQHNRFASNKIIALTEMVKVSWNRYLITETW